MNRPSLDDYIDVAERIVLFKATYPDGSLQTLDWRVTDVAGRTFVVYRAAAYRTPDDERPGHGTAWEPFPGPTPYTKDSELMNAETAAWGRACVAVGIMANRKIASRQEVRARRGEETGSAQAAATSTGRPELREAARGLRWAAVKEAYTAAGLTPPDAARDAFTGLTDAEAAKLRGALIGRKIADTTDVPFTAGDIASTASTTAWTDLPWAGDVAVAEASASSVPTEDEIVEKLKTELGGEEVETDA